MKLSELIRDYIDLKIEGEPKRGEWLSIDANSRQQQSYRFRLEELEADIDIAIAAMKDAA